MIQRVTRQAGLRVNRAECNIEYIAISPSIHPSIHPSNQRARQIPGVPRWRKVFTFIITISSVNQRRRRNALKSSTFIQKAGMFALAPFAHSASYVANRTTERTVDLLPHLREACPGRSRCSSWRRWQRPARSPTR
jgi:hypothetical protein